MIKMVRLENLDCANCAAKLERAIAKIDGVENVSVNFMAQRMNLQLNDKGAQRVIEEIKKTFRRVEPDCVLKGL